MWIVATLTLLSGVIVAVRMSDTPQQRPATVGPER